MSRKKNKKNWVKPEINIMSCADAEGSGKKYTPYSESEIGNK